MTPGSPRRRQGRSAIRNRTWRHLNARDVISMPDPWEYPWFAAWDLAFHTVALAHVDPGFAKGQLDLLLHEWYQHPNGAIPAYEWNFSDLNPPVHAWAALRVFEIDGSRDTDFLVRIFPKLLMNFTWWVNQQDPDGNSLFGGGFLGLDNIGPIDRSNLPAGYTLQQADGTAWMAFYCTQMLGMLNYMVHAGQPVDHLLVTFLQHFMSINEAMDAEGIWDEEDGYFYDQLIYPDGTRAPLRVTSLVGAMPVVAAESIQLRPDNEVRARATAQRMRSALLERLDHVGDPLSHDDEAPVDLSVDMRRLSLSVVTPDDLRRVLAKLLDESQMLSTFGIRSLSAHHREEPFRIGAAGQEWAISYEPGESTTGMYGGNSNWRGPIWMPINHLLVHALGEHHETLGEGFTVEYPTGSGQQRNLAEVAADLRERLISMFVPGPDGVVPSRGTPRRGHAAADATRGGRATRCSTSTSTATPGLGWGLPPDRVDRAGRRPDHPRAVMTGPVAEQARGFRRPDRVQRLRAHPRRMARPAGERPDEPGVRGCGRRGAGAHLATCGGQARRDPRLQRRAHPGRCRQRRVPRAAARGGQGDARCADPGADRPGPGDPVHPVASWARRRCRDGVAAGAASWPQRSWRHWRRTPGAAPARPPATRTARCSSTAPGTC